LPVVRIDLRRFSKMVGAGRARILDRLPYIGLDIEGADEDSVRVEYSPNRPDYGTDFGISRSLKGLLGKEVGMPHYPVNPSGVSVSVDAKLSFVRPFIACATATGLRLGAEDVRQIISLQEDLHNGLGRRRKKVAIGLHDLEAVTPPFSYAAVRSDFRFTPLEGKKSVTISQILSQTAEGRAYGPALGGSRLFPIITDSRGEVLSFPPVINGDLTKVTTKTRNMFIDVTSTDRKVGDDVLAIMITTLAEAGAKIGTVSLRYATGPRVTPDLTPVRLALELDLIVSALGLDLTKRQVVEALGRSRLSVKGDTAMAARYRIDLLHPVDIIEEVALGYGIDRIESLYPPSKQPGNFHPFEQFLDSTSTVMAGSEMLELMTFELVDEESLYAKFGRPSDGKIVVHEPRSLEHSVLRDSLIPNLMAAISSNVKSDYPQRVFEIGRVFMRAEGGVSEAWHLGCLVAHSQASYSEAKMYLESVCRTLTGRELMAEESQHWAFAAGRCAAVDTGGQPLGYVGELKPEAIDAFGLKVPVSGFELDLSVLHKQLK
jgi:phenylalanyl-tRNA synthetase beta chain